MRQAAVFVDDKHNANYVPMWGVKKMNRFNRMGFHQIRF